MASRQCSRYYDSHNYMLFWVRRADILLTTIDIDNRRAQLFRLFRAATASRPANFIGLNGLFRRMAIAAELVQHA